MKNKATNKLFANESYIAVKGNIFLGNTNE